MPTYEYECPKCGKFEQFHSINTVLTQCPQCGGAVRRLISLNNNVIFKGSGFYTTDYRSDNHKGKTAPDKSSSLAGAASSASSTSTSPAGSDSHQTGGSKSANTASSSTKSESKAS